MTGKYVAEQFEFAGGVCPVDDVEDVECIAHEDRETAAAETFSVISYDAYDFLSIVVAVGIETEEAALFLAGAHKAWLRKQPDTIEELDRVTIMQKVIIPES